MQNLNIAVLKWTSHNTDKLHWAPSCPKVFTVAGEPAQLSKRQHLHYNTHIHARTLSLSLTESTRSPTVHSDQKQPFTDMQSTVSRICSTISICHSRYVDCYRHITDDASSTKLVIMKTTSLWQITELDVDQSCHYATHGDEEMSFSVANFQMMSITNK